MIHPGCDVVCNDHVGVRVARVGGVLDVFSAGCVETRILAGIPPDATVLVLELEHIERIDSAGMSALVRLREHARSRALDVHVHLGDEPRVNPTVLGVLQRVFVVDDVVDLTSDEPLDGHTAVGSAG